MEVSDHLLVSCLFLEVVSFCWTYEARRLVFGFKFTHPAFGTYVVEPFPKFESHNRQASFRLHGWPLQTYSMDWWCWLSSFIFALAYWVSKTSKYSFIWEFTSSCVEPKVYRVFFKAYITCLRLIMLFNWVSIMFKWVLFQVSVSNVFETDRLKVIWFDF